MSSPLAAYVLLFLAVGAGFVLINLLVGKLFRPHRPDAEKGTVYECGEPTIGSAWVQFDLRYYVIALLFVIFDVEVAFFFPWAEVFGKANAIAEVGPPTNVAAIHELADRALPLTAAPEKSRPADRSPEAIALALRSTVPAVYRWGQLMAIDEATLAHYQELRSARRKLTEAEDKELQGLKALLDWSPATEREVPHQGAAGAVYEGAQSIRWLAFWEIIVFFGVLLVGFAYLWRRGDLAWVRSLPERQAAVREEPPLAAAAPVKETVPVPEEAIRS
jgi:NADH-quinone oxidoreductase subunit A